MHVRPKVFVLAALLFSALGILQFVSAQSLDLGGRAYVDYFYTLTTPNAAAEGLHGFTYRRLYLTADYTLSEDFEGRARLEANEGTTGPNGPVPYVKDLYLTWQYSGEHSATLGVTSPPAFDVSDDIWGYRSLEKTLLDLQGIASSRDFGLRFDGPLGSGELLSYAVMLANNSGVRPETDAYKRIYGQLVGTPTNRLTLVAGADVAGYEEGPGVRLSAFGSYETELFRVGLEGYWYRRAFDTASTVRDAGVSAFGVVQVAPAWELIARFDRSRERAPAFGRPETLFLAAVAYRPHPNVVLMPNLRLRNAAEREDPQTLGRFTVEVSF